ncbi:hypothetical protein [Cryobacterium sp. TmT2-59]|nr:hypothetical protein [Cryobacterium sp. TmT2-59]
MKAIIQHAYGTADVLTLEDTDSPTVGANDVLIRVRSPRREPYRWRS